MSEAHTIEVRTAPAERIASLIEDGTPPLLAQIYAARGIQSVAQLDTDLRGLIPYAELTNVERMATLAADAIATGTKLLIIADYDSDGATACAVGVRALRALGANVDYLVPNRFEYGYGLTPEIVALAKQTKNPDVLITVDNGIASVEGVAAANAAGMRVWVTDHHLPGDELPAAECIINPNQPGCSFPSKNLAGVGVMFYLTLALRAELRKRGAFATRSEPNLGSLLDLVALGTVADVVKLDDNNRRLVAQGLERIRAGKTWPGVAALLRIAGRDPRRASTYDLGFVLGPRLNAAGRIDDMSRGINCLISDDAAAASRMAQELDQLNKQRRAIESDMHETAMAKLDALATGDDYSLCLFDEEWHQGVIGILASRLKERLHRPVIAFARGNNGEIKGSGRSISALHLRDALDLVTKRAPGLIIRFGGHAAAAGLTLREADFARFRQLFEDVVRAMLTSADLERVIATDGPLASQHLTLDTAAVIEQAVWGQGFPAPTFCDTFEVLQQRTVGGRHAKLRLRKGDGEFEAMLFSHADPLPPRVRAVYRLGVNEFNATRSLQITFEHWQPA
ncbi:MAG: single-stranded-DNA-specific exonuclease RecJ [Betaproteobacteria bacterium]|nr:single-stranded-DNA-specific exonuclease RecJ [Betaproteobacteria bacterium]